ncbi:MAG: hypothetical protein NTW87_19125 [Planctomycetota bacterium]|nr:hypothetical protein [Planctomycetota bacterium]
MKVHHLTCLASVLTAFAFAADVSAPPAEPITQGQRVYAMGHSFHVGLPPIIQQIAKSAGIADHQIAGVSSIGGSQVIQHWNEKNRAALAAGNVDVATLTPIYLPDDGIEKFAKLSLEAPSHFRVTVQEFWLPFDAYEPHYYHLPPKKPTPATVDHNAPTGESLRKMHAQYFDEMDALVRSVNQKLGKQVLFVVPVGQAVIALREKIIAGQAPGLQAQAELFTDALGHPTAPLQVLIAYCHFSVIYRRTPVGLPLPDVLAKARKPNWDEKLNRLLQELAWDAVTHHPLSGVSATQPAKP